MKAASSQSHGWMARRRVVLLTCCALVLGLTGWLCTSRPGPLQKEVEAVGGRYVEKNLDLVSDTSTPLWHRAPNAAFSTTLGVERRSIDIIFYKSDVSDDWVRKNAEAMRKLPVHYLSFRGTGITDEAVAALADMKGLRMLDLSGTSITDQSMAAIRGMTELQRIDLTGTDVTQEGISQLSDHPLLKHVDLDGDVLTDETVAYFNAMPGIQSVGLKHFNDEQLGRLAGLTSVHTLSLTGATDESLPLLLQLTRLSNLTLWDSELSPVALETIRTASPGLTIEEYVSLETAEELGITDGLIASQRRFVVILRLVIALSAGSLVLLAVPVWRRREAKRIQVAMREEGVP